uniref:Uncharacterized protein n=1 Tax=Proboscia inermis TaxID=420281 RepID=A0A7S0GHQ9_9STRA|mmetsp:Transcript_50780/g.51184  ORF Transcript_50780/g.51184 Transcript_50780/m.51184 type:complete len:127 (+) Transcript_50780:275-655(+)
MKVTVYTPGRYRCPNRNMCNRYCYTHTSPGMRKHKRSMDGRTNNGGYGDCITINSSNATTTMIRLNTHLERADIFNVVHAVAVIIGLCVYGECVIGNNDGHTIASQPLCVALSIEPVHLFERLGDE